MNALDIVLTIISVFCFGAAFLIASRPMYKTKAKTQVWETNRSSHKSSVEMYSSITDETQ